jgi:hypothetical protein
VLLRESVGRLVEKDRRAWGEWGLGWVMTWIAERLENGTENFCMISL